MVKISSKAQAPQTEGDESFCHCGTHAEALAVATKLFVDMLASDCGAWAFQVGAALKTLAVDHMVDAKIPMAEIKQLGDECTRLTRRDAPKPETLVIFAMEKASKL